ncbi:hypothetical protein [Prevotella sp.]
MRIARIEADAFVNRKRSLTPVHLQPHPPTPLRMERGVKTTSRMEEDG